MCVSLYVHTFVLDCMHVYGRLLVRVLVCVCVHVKLVCGFRVCVHMHVCIWWRGGGGGRRRRKERVGPHDQRS